MNAQRIIVIAMIVVSSLLTAWASTDIAFPAILCMLALVGTQGRFTWDIRPERKFVTPLLLLVLAILFAIHCQYTDVRNDEAAIFAWATIARYFLASMTLLLFLRPASRLPPSLGLYHLANAMAAGQALLLDDVYIGFRLAELLGVTLVVLYAVAELSSRRSPRRTEGIGSPLERPRPHFGVHASHVVLLVVALNFGWLGGSLLYRNVELFNALPSWIFRSGITLEATSEGVSRVGFSTSGQLGSVFTMIADEDPTPALTIDAERNPGYLRARAYEVYRRSQWNDLSYRDAIYPEQNTPFGSYLVARLNLFQIAEREPSRSITIRHESSLGDAMFTALGTCTVEAPFHLLMSDDDQVVSAPSTRSNLAYRIGTTPAVPGPRPSGVHLRRMMNIPVHLDPRVEQLAQRIFAGRETPAEKIQAVVSHFNANYSYQLGLDVPFERDDLEYFLLEAETGYCEYFASGAAILLRFAGVPTRYVTGFFVSEQTEDGRAWVARNMDAHAWVEAWDRERSQWVIVEATPQQVIGNTTLADGSGDGGGGGRLLLRRLSQALYDYGLFGIVAWFFESYSLETAVVISLAFAGAALWLSLFRRYGRTRRRRSTRGAPRPEFAALHRLLAMMDRKARSAGLRRGLGETLPAFARRIRNDIATGQGPELADWYLAYADLRYRPVIPPDRLEHLREQARLFGRRQ